MYTVPNAQPPSRKCHAGCTSKNGLVGEPIVFSSSAIAPVPTATLTMMRQEPTPVMTSTRAPARQAITDVSPIDPGIRPMKASHKLTASATAGVPPSVARASRVAPLTPSAEVCAATQTVSPECSAG